MDLPILTPLVIVDQGNSMMRDLVIGIVLVFLMAILLLDAQAIPDSPYEPLGPRFLAELIPAALFLLGIVLIGRSVRTLRRSPTSRTPSSETKMVNYERLTTTVLVLGGLCAYVFVLELGGGEVGYLISTIVFFCVLGGVLVNRRKMSRKTPFAVLAVSTTLATGAWWLFSEFLHVSLP